MHNRNSALNLIIFRGICFCMTFTYISYSNAYIIFVNSTNPAIKSTRLIKSHRFKADTVYSFCLIHRIRFIVVWYPLLLMCAYMCSFFYSPHKSILRSIEFSEIIIIMERAKTTDQQNQFTKMSVCMYVHRTYI